jgi:hypothetical protein
MIFKRMAPRLLTLILLLIGLCDASAVQNIQLTKNQFHLCTSIGGLRSLAEQLKVMQHPSTVVVGDSDTAASTHTAAGAHAQHDDHQTQSYASYLI